MDPHRRLRRLVKPVRAITLALALLALAIAAFIGGCLPGQNRERLPDGPVTTRTIPAATPLPSLTAPRRGRRRPRLPPRPAPTPPPPPISTKTPPPTTERPSAATLSPTPASRIAADTARDFRRHMNSGRSRPILSLVATLTPGKKRNRGPEAAGDCGSSPGSREPGLGCRHGRAGLGPIEKVALAKDIPTAAPVPTARRGPRRRRLLHAPNLPEHRSPTDRTSSWRACAYGMPSRTAGLSTGPCSTAAWATSCTST